VRDSKRRRCTAGTNRAGANRAARAWGFIEASSRARPSPGEQPSSRGHRE
jgi:hypothetical protein